MSDYDYSSDAGETTDGYGDEGSETESGTDASTDANVDVSEGESEVLVPSGPEMDTYVGNETTENASVTEVTLPTGPEGGIRVDDATGHESEAGTYVGAGEVGDDKGVYVGDAATSREGDATVVAEGDKNDKTDVETEKSTSEESSGENGSEKLDVDGKIESYLESLPEEDRAKQAAALDKMTAEERAVYAQNLENEPQITAAMQEIAEKNGGELQGLEYRVKTPSSTYEKMHERDEETDIHDMNDIIRYTQIYTGDKLAEGANASLTDMQEKGYTVERVKNTWDEENATYRGINAVVCDPNGQRFEVQFHTQESFELKNGELHALYEERRTMSDDDPRAVEIDERMIELSAQLERPENIEEVKNI